MILSEIQSWLESSGFLQQFFQNFRTTVPGRVVSFDKEMNTATISVAIQDLNSAEEPIPGIAQLYSVPVVMMGGQNNYITCELTAGDLGVLMICDRDIDNFKTTKAPAVVATPGIANLKDSVFLPGLFRPASDGITVSSTTKITLKSGASTALITPSQIKFTIGSSVVTMTSSSIDIQGGSAEIQMTGGNVNITGNLIVNEALTFGSTGNVTGNITLDGSINGNANISTSADVLAQGISLHGHHHGGVTTGGGNTGGPA